MVIARTGSRKKHGRWGQGTLSRRQIAGEQIREGKGIGAALGKGAELTFWPGLVNEEVSYMTKMLIHNALVFFCYYRANSMSVFKSVHTYTAQK